MRDDNQPLNAKQALADISDIRNQIAAGKMFRGFGPAIIALTGVLAFVITGLQLLWPETFAPSPTYLLGIWIFAAFVSVFLIGLEMVARSRRHHGGLAVSMNTNAMETFLPIGAAGAVIGLVILMNTPQTVWVLPGFWQVLVGIGTFSALKFLPQRVVFVSAWYFVAGAGALIIGSTNQSLSPLMMGIPFTVGQFLMAGFLHTALEVSDVK